LAKEWAKLHSNLANAVNTFGAKSAQVAEIRKIIVAFVNKYIPDEAEDKGPIPTFEQLSLAWQEQHEQQQPKQDPNKMDFAPTG
jgi:hypothetical protein